VSHTLVAVVVGRTPMHLLLILRVDQVVGAMDTAWVRLPPLATTDWVEAVVVVDTVLLHPSGLLLDQAVVLES
jgi:hypothetical protein